MAIFGRAYFLLFLWVSGFFPMGGGKCREYSGSADFAHVSDGGGQPHLRQKIVGEYIKENVSGYYATSLFLIIDSLRE